MEINDIIRQNAGILTDEQLTSHINLVFQKNFKVASIKKRRQRLGIKKACGRGLCLVVKRESRHDTNTRSDT